LRAGLSQSSYEEADFPVKRLIFPVKKHFAEAGKFRAHADADWRASANLPVKKLFSCEEADFL
jgi:hypothetical protein